VYFYDLKYCKINYFKKNLIEIRKEDLFAFELHCKQIEIKIKPGGRGFTFSMGF
jgi:hypothetical protein